MRRRLSTRIGSLALLLAFLGALEGSAARVGGCPHHGADRDAAAQPHDVHAVAVVSGPEGPERPGERGGCTCVGSCHAGAAAPLVPTPSTLAGVPLSASRLVPPSVRSSCAESVPYLLPYPNPPPSL